jgi:mannose-1-phosphate guanylyltransferase
MKVVLFAGGTGRRLWPISRKQSPKQFEPMVGEQSTVQMSAGRLAGRYGVENLLVSTNEAYVPILGRQLPWLPAGNFIAEPARRDLGAAVGLAMMHVSRRAEPDEPVAIVWGDNYMTEVDAFLRLLDTAQVILEREVAEIALIGERPRFANTNLGWIGLGEQLGTAVGQPYFACDSWVYRPALEECLRMVESGSFAWNTGYFVTRPAFILEAYRTHQPELFAGLQAIGEVIGRPEYDAVLGEVYPQLEEIHFDDAIVKKVGRRHGVVLCGETGWSDPGTLYALKESINPSPEANVTRGLVRALQSKDCLLYNYEEGKLLAVAGLDGMIVVNTHDAVLIVHKDDIRLVKELVDGLAGGELDSYS